MSALHIDLHRRDVVRCLGLLGCLLLASVMSGWLIAHGDLKYLLALGAATAMVLLAVKVRWLLVSVLVLAVLDGLPGLNIADLHSAGTFNPTTVCALLLVGIAAFNLASNRSSELSRGQRSLFLWAAIFVAVWLIAWVRAVGDGVAVLKALTFGQAFLIFGLLLPLAPWLLRSKREVRRFLSVLVFVGIIYAIGEIAVSLGMISPSVINVSLTASQGGVTRVYAPMGDAVFLILSCSIGVSLLSKGPMARRALLAAVITGIAVAFELTRAQYFALGAGLVAALLIIGLRGAPSTKARISWRLLCSAGAVVLILGVAAVTVPSIAQTSAVREVASRTTTGLADLTGQGSNSGNTLAYRQSLDSSMLAILGGKWPIGLGFLAPSTFYFTQLPSGSIMNTDVGVVNVFMTLGAVGAVLLYIPVIGFLLWTVAGLRQDDRAVAERLGVTVWVVAVLAGSVTLYTLFSTGGLVLVAVSIGLCMRRWSTHERGSAAGAVVPPGRYSSRLLTRQ